MTEFKKLLSAAADLDAKKEFGASGFLKTAALYQPKPEPSESERNAIAALQEEIAAAEDRGALSTAGRKKTELLKLMRQQER